MTHGTVVGAALCVAALMTAVSCGKGEVREVQPAVVVPGDPNEERLTIEENTQGEFQKLRIGVGNIWERDLPDASGATKKTLSAQAWIFYEDDEKKNVTEVVFQGKEMAVAEYGIRVTDVRAVDGKGQVTLDVWRNKEGPPPAGKGPR